MPIIKFTNYIVIIIYSLNTYSIDEQVGHTLIQIQYNIIIMFNFIELL